MSSVLFFSDSCVILSMGTWYKLLSFLPACSEALSCPCVDRKAGESQPPPLVEENLSWLDKESSQLLLFQKSTEPSSGCFGTPQTLVRGAIILFFKIYKLIYCWFNLSRLVPRKQRREGAWFFTRLYHIWLEEESASYVLTQWLYEKQSWLNCMIELYWNILCSSHLGQYKILTWA